MIYDITPMAKPRMTQRDKWKKRPIVLRYQAFCDEVRLRKVPFPESGAAITFFLPMPKSWSEKKKEAMAHKPHLQRPDLDNLIKALADAVHKDDSRIWDFSCSKFWARAGCIGVRMRSPAEQ